MSTLADYALTRVEALERQVVAQALLIQRLTTRLDAVLAAVEGQLNAPAYEGSDRPDLITFQIALRTALES